jgi:RNA polymerase sigma-70 factor (ECF subfamily)
LVGAADCHAPEESLPDFDAVFRRFAPYVASIGIKILGSEDELDDLVQEVFIAAHRGLAGVREPAALRTWLVRICVRRATRRLRRRRRWAWLSLDRVPPEAIPTHPSASPEHAANLASAYRLLDRVSAEERAAWVLRHVEGEPLENIASLCGCSKSTVQRRLRAVQRLFERESRESER